MVSRCLCHLGRRFALHLASFLKFAMCNIYKNNIAKMMFDFYFRFKIVHVTEFFF